MSTPLDICFFPQKVPGTQSSSVPQYAELAHISASTKQLLHTATTMSSSKKDSIRMQICTLKTIEYLVVLFNLIFIERLLKEQ